jgi:predicted permease
MRALKLALRTLFKTPFVTLVAVLSLALGIGANSAIFSLFNQVLLQALPVREPGRLVDLAAPGPKPGSQSCNQAGDCDAVFSYPMYRDLERTQTVLTGLAGHRSFGANLSFRDQPLNGDGMLVSGSYFPILGLKPALGRLLGPSDDQNVGGHFVTVLSYTAWVNRFGGDRGVLGQTIVINGKPYEIVGVAPSGFEGTTLGTRPLVFVPLGMRGEAEPGFDGFANRRTYWIYVFGRLKPGVTMERAGIALNALYHPILTDVEAPLQKGMSEKTLARFKAKTLVLESGARGQSSVHREARTPLYMLFGISAIVLLIACANIANLLLARGANRSMEMAVRLALGAGRVRVLTQLLTESVLLALMGGVASLAVARGTLALMASLLPSEVLRTLQFELDPPVVLFAAALSVGTGFLFGMFPALHATRSDLVTSIRANAGQITGHRSAARFRATLVVVQIALSMALLTSAGLFLKSLLNVSRVDLGLNAESVVTFGISPELSGYDSTRSAGLFERVEDQLAALPGATAVTSASVPLIAGDNWGTSVRVQGFVAGPDTDTGSRYNEVGPGFFGAVGMKLLAGREFTRADSRGAPRVAVVNEAFAKKFNLGRDAVGKFMSTNGRDTLNIQIVGLVRNAKYSEVKQEVPPVVFMPWRQNPGIGSINFYVRSSLPPSQMLGAIPVVLKRLDAGLPVEGLKTLPQQIRESVFLDRMISILSASFAALATLLAAVGLYGVLAYSVAQRTREIGVRLALGADGRRVRRMVMRQVAGMAIVGGVIGVGGALALGKSAGSLLFGLNGRDPVVFGLAGLLLGLVAMGAGYVPARRAARVEPMQALRYE